MNEIFSAPAIISEDMHLPWFYQFLAKDIPP
jgi:hypothetical protein